MILFVNDTIDGFGDLWELKISVKCADGFQIKGLGRDPCPLGTFGVNQTCIRCPAGFFADKESMTACNPCNNYEYQPHIGQKRCIECPSHSDCSSTQFACHPGYTADYNITTCVQCQRSYWKLDSGNHACRPCPSGADYCEGNKCFYTGNRPCAFYSPNIWIDNPLLGLSMVIVLSVFFYNWIYAWLSPDFPFRDEA